MSAAHREENANILVCQSLNWLLGERRVTSEEKGRADGKFIDLNFTGETRTRIFIEAKYEGRDPAAARRAAEAAAEGRRELQDAPDIVGGLVYSTPFEKDPRRAILEEAEVQFGFKARGSDAPLVWRRGTVYDLAQSLRRPEMIIDPERDEIGEMVAHINNSLIAFSGAIVNRPVVARKVARVLQMALAPQGSDKHAEQLQEAARVSGLILIGALMFQLALSEVDERVKKPYGKDISLVPDIKEHWRYIVEDINYWSVFLIAGDILSAASIWPKDLRRLINVAESVLKLSHSGSDVMGRIYHTVLADAKTLAAYYTAVPSATLMAGIALSPKLNADKGVDWSDAKSIGKLRIADPACGSGTLLAAACWQVRDNFARALFKKDIEQYGGGARLAEKSREVHKTLMEQCVWGYDILENAVHLSAITLGLMSPAVDFRQSHLMPMIIGKTEDGNVAAGSLELLDAARPLQRRSYHLEDAPEVSDDLPPLDVCIMNPPFVRGTAGNTMFGFLPPDEQKAVHDKLRRLGKKYDFSSDGQGAAFVTLACLARNRDIHFIKPGGRLAVILPFSALNGTGAAWTKMRRAIEARFDIEAVIASWDAQRPAFSESTNLQECIIIARRLPLGGAGSDEALFVSLRHNPTNNEQAIIAAHAVVDELTRDKQKRYGELSDEYVAHANGDTGRFARLPYRGMEAWRGASFADVRLSLAASEFYRAGTLFPFVKSAAAVAPLRSIATLGSVRLDKYIRKSASEEPSCEISYDGETPYAGYYPGHLAKRHNVAQRELRSVAEQPHCHVRPVAGKEAWIDNYYASAGRIVVAASFRFNTMSRVAALCAKPVQCAHYTPVKLRSDSEQEMKILTLWLNSSINLLLMAYISTPTDKSKVNVSKAAVSNMPVPDMSQLSPAHKESLAALFDDIAAGDGFSLIREMDADPVRVKIDDAFAAAFGWSAEELAFLRQALMRETIICNQ